MMRKALAVVVVAGLTVCLAGGAKARDQIRIVGSSTVFPFSTAVAEQFGKTTKYKTPVVESTGSGGGLKLFCAGVGEQHPDFSNASRRIKKSELETCRRNGVTDITEIKIGYDGIVLANSKAAAQMNINRKQIYLALAKDLPDGKGGFMANPNKRWSDVAASLPNIPIEVLGPPPTSGTRDAFDELAMQGGCKQIHAVAVLEKSDPKKFKAVCQSLREDGAYVEAGENDVLIVRKLEANPNAFGIFGYSFLDQNQDRIQGSKIDGQVPTFDDISSGAYVLSRPLFFYVKKAHLGSIPGMKDYIAEFTSEKAWGPEGYLADKGLVPMSDAERKTYRQVARDLADNIHL